MFIAKIPRILSRTFRSLTWEIPAHGKEVFLTFDDGPTPEVTGWVLDTLAHYNAKATFFCLGNNVEKHPRLYQRILEEGHTVGNHTYSHKKGFRSGVGSYIADVEKAAQLIDSNLFRPPYGRILPGQVRAIKKEFRIIMWSVLSVDYDAGLDGERVVRNVTENVCPGSIIVFHDSVKASKNLFHALPKVLEYLGEKGFVLLPLAQEKLRNRNGSR